ncbi:MAG: hypothetical protein WC483_06465 [Candidatus Paceibacterota bacterium]
MRIAGRAGEAGRAPPPLLPPPLRGGGMGWGLSLLPLHCRKASAAGLNRSPVRFRCASFRSASVPWPISTAASSSPMMS